MDKTIFAVVGRLPPVPLLSVDENDVDLDVKFLAVKLTAMTTAIAAGSRLPTFEVK